MEEVQMKQLMIALFLLTMAVPAVAQEEKDSVLPKGMEVGYALDWATHRWGLSIMTDNDFDRKEKLPNAVRIGKDETYSTGLVKILPARYTFRDLEDTGIVRIVATPNVPKGTLVGGNQPARPASFPAAAPKAPTQVAQTAPKVTAPKLEPPAPTAPAPVAQAAPAIAPAQPKRPDTGIAPQSHSMDEINQGDQRPARSGYPSAGSSLPNFQQVPQVNPAAVQYAGGYGYANPLGVPPTYGSAVSPLPYRTSICGDSPVVVGCTQFYGNVPGVEYQRVGYGPNDFQTVAPRAYPAGYNYGGYGYYGSGSYYNSGFYGLPLFNFQLEELQAQFRDRRQTALIKFKGGNGCDNRCLSNVHVVAMVNGKEYYLAGANMKNNWYDSALMVPLDANNTVDLWVIREEAGVMRGFERHMWLPSRSMTKDAMPFAIEQAMFDQSREIKILQQHVSVETEPGQYETRGGAAGMPVRR
jgi:hypothetical protein